MPELRVHAAPGTKSILHFSFLILHFSLVLINCRRVFVKQDVKADKEGNGGNVLFASGGEGGVVEVEAVEDLVVVVARGDGRVVGELGGVGPAHISRRETSPH